MIEIGFGRIGPAYTFLKPDLYKQGLYGIIFENTGK